LTRFMYKQLLGKKLLGIMSLVFALSVMAVPFMASASNANRVFYMPDQTTFNPAAAWGGDIANGGGNGINKLTILGTAQGGTVDFIVRNNNESGKTGSTLFEVRKGPGNNDLSGGVTLANNAAYADGGQTTLVTFSGKGVDAPLYVRVSLPPCAEGGTFRIQAHPGGTLHQGNGPGVVVFLACGQTPPPTCYDYNGNPIDCPASAMIGRD